MLVENNYQQRKPPKTASRFFTQPSPHGKFFPDTTISLLYKPRIDKKPPGFPIFSGTLASILLLRSEYTSFISHKQICRYNSAWEKNFAASLPNAPGKSNWKSISPTPGESLLRPENPATPDQTNHLTSNMGSYPGGFFYLWYYAISYLQVPDTFPSNRQSGKEACFRIQFPGCAAIQGKLSGTPAKLPLGTPPLYIPQYFPLHRMPVQASASVGEKRAKVIFLKVLSVKRRGLSGPGPTIHPPWAMLVKPQTHHLPTQNTSSS